MLNIVPVPYDVLGYLETLTGVYGQEICIDHPEHGSMEFVYVYKADATAKGDLLIWSKSGTALGLNPTAIAPATTATPLQAWCGPAQMATTAAGGLWVQRSGRCICIKLDGGTDVADADLIQLTNGQVYAIKDSAFGQETIGVSEEAETKSIAEQVTAAETTWDHQVYLFGNRVVI